jgi:transposase
MASYLGIDVSKDQLDAVLLREDGQRESGRFDNTRKGFNQLRHFLKKRGKGAIHVGLEATGHYSDEVALFLHEAGYLVSVINPAQIKSYADSQLRRTKTDASDAAVIADFCRTQQPALWQPPAPEVRELQALMRHRGALLQMRQQENNRLASGQHSATVRHSIQEHVAFITEQLGDLDRRIRQHLDQHPDLRRQRDLLTSIPGIGDVTAAQLLAELPSWAASATPRQIAAYAGLAPRQHVSGSSVRRPSRLSKRGSTRLRRALYMPAISAKRYLPALHVFAQRLLDAGKPTMAVIAAVMRKLLLLAHAILKSGRPFDPNYALHFTPTT